jgi:cytidylate kinase
VNGHDVTEAIRTPETDVAAASVARLPVVREALVSRQRALGENGRLVMEGRDIGTVVFPAAAAKIYLDASPDERARRRAADPAHASGRNRALADVASALEARDTSDRTRDASPLTLAPDAELIDTTGVPIGDVVTRVLSLVRSRLGGAPSAPAG